MLIAIIGENCVGKSTLANNIKQAFGANIYTGKDYLRLEKNPSVAIEKFKSILQESVSGGNIIYLITEQDHLNLLPQGTIKIVLTASLETIKACFKERMRGNLPFPVEKMLEAGHGIYDNLDCDMKLDEGYNIDEVLKALKLSI